MPTAQFDSGMRKGINYYDRGMYYEARDELQWFADYNWGALNVSRRSYLRYPDDAKAKVKEIENENSRLTQQQFDNGMKKGINYFNKGMYYGGTPDELEWFCDGELGQDEQRSRHKMLSMILTVRKRR